MSEATWPRLVEGRLVDADGAPEPVDDGALGLGAALFETLALRGGRLRLVDGHLDRLERSVRAFGWRSEPRATLRRGLEAVAAAVPAGAGAVRLTVAPAAQSGPRWWISSRPLPPVPDPLLLWPAEPTVRPGDLFEQVKHTGRLPKLHLRERARAAGAHDALLSTLDGDLVEATVSNLWIVVDGRLRTPPSPRGCLPGVVRAAILADDSGPLPTEVAPIWPADFDRAEELLLTNSLTGPLGVEGVLGRRADLPGSQGAHLEALRTRFFELEGR